MNGKCTSTVVYVDTTHLLYGIFHVLICTCIHSQQVCVPTSDYFSRSRKWQIRLEIFKKVGFFRLFVATRGPIALRRLDLVFYTKNISIFSEEKRIIIEEVDINYSALNIQWNAYVYKTSVYTTLVVYFPSLFTKDPWISLISHITTFVFWGIPALESATYNWPCPKTGEGRYILK